MAEHKIIDEVFKEDKSLAQRVQDAIQRSPSYRLLFMDIANYINNVHNASIERAQHKENNDSIVLKKRKLENSTQAQPNGASPQDQYDLFFEAKDISFTVPMRRKLNLELAKNAVPEASGTLPSYQVRARSKAPGNIEYEAELQSFKYALRLPVPERAQKQFCFVLLSHAGFDASEKALNPPATESEPLVWTLNDRATYVTVCTDSDLKANIQAENSELIHHVLKKSLEQIPSGYLMEPEESEFISASSESHRKKMHYHAKAFKGNKEGYLFFLSAGIFFGFKRPFGFVPFDLIDSVSYTSVLQRTFNLSISTRGLNQDETNEHEFSMIDQAEFSGIDSYVKRHQLHDSSLAESRRAKIFHVNADRTRAADGEPKQTSELEKAEAEMEDAEDAEEEDYEPQSREDLSDGSRTSSNEDASSEEDSGTNDDNLVARELGSEAEEIPTDE